jgi:uncharacterized protein involved in propanediol utilization
VTARTVRRTRDLRAPGAGRPARPGICARVGTASSAVHHGELLQGVFRDADGRTHRGLVTMPCDLFRTRAIFVPTPAPPVVVWPPARAKSRRAVQKTLTLLGRPASGGYLELAGDAPPARGFGSSTSDVVAAILAVQDAFDCELQDHLVARIAVQAEIASDPVMYDDRAVLFAQREGWVMEDFGRPLPPLAVLGFGTSPDGAGIDTLALPPAVYADWEVDRFEELRHELRGGIRAGDAAAVGAVATGSAVLSQRHLAVDIFDVIRPLVRRSGAVGLQVAHSGDIAGLLFDGADPELTARLHYARRLLQDAGINQTWRFDIGG